MEPAKRFKLEALKLLAKNMPVRAVFPISFFVAVIFLLIDILTSKVTIWWLLGYAVFAFGFAAFPSEKYQELGRLTDVLFKLKLPERYADFVLRYGEVNRLGRRVPSRNCLRAQEWYQLEIAVRMKPIGIPPKLTKRFPIREPKQTKDVTILVAIDGEGFEIEEPVQTLTLPPLGNSTKNAFFRVRPLLPSAGIGDLAKIRVRLYYRLNLLEVALISAEVVGKFDSPAQSKLGLKQPIEFQQKLLMHEYKDFDYMQPREMHIYIEKMASHYLLYFTFYKAEDQKVALTAPARFQSTDLEHALTRIRKIWYEIALSETFANRLHAEKDEFISNVRRLASEGRKLWLLLFKLETGSSIYKIGELLERESPEQDGIIQVSVHGDAADFVFPWSLIYDRLMPEKDYELPDLYGFWGIRYCIEQQLPSIFKGTDEPVFIEDELRVGFALWDRFRNADKEKLLMQALMKESTRKLGISTPPITRDDRCFELLEDCDSHILYFYTHGYTGHREADIGVGPNLRYFLERYERLDSDSPLRDFYRFLYDSIKKGEFDQSDSWIELTYGKVYLDQLYNRIHRLKSGPFVILNMCESAQITPSLKKSFIHFFIDRGAMGVLGTECPMTIEFAHPFAEKFLRHFLAGESAGKVLLNARRHFMTEYKNPLALAYTLFGSATASFTPPRF